MKKICINNSIKTANCYSLNEAYSICKPLLNGKNFIVFLQELKCRVPYGLVIGNTSNNTIARFAEISKDEALGISHKLNVYVTKVGLNTILKSALKCYHEKRTLT